MEFDKLVPFIEKRKALEAALTLFSFDCETAPENAIDHTSKIIGILSNDYFNLIQDKEVEKILAQLDESKLDLRQKAMVKEWRKVLNQFKKIPANEYLENEELIVKSRSAYLKAKEANDFEIFKPYLKQIIENQKRFAKYRRVNEENLYDVLLNDYEEGFTVKKLDEFFGLLKSEIVPLLKAIQNSDKKIKRDFIFKYYDIDLQRQLSKEIAKLIGFDFKAGQLVETEHPYTTELHNKDVRITTHFFEDNLESGLYSTIHEAGHGLYEQGISDDIALTTIGQGGSMGIHESQSRFYENVIGRSEGFIQLIYPKIKQLFKEQLENVSVHEFYEAVNHVEASLIRTEADELTYSLHIMIRYEIEKMLFNDEITIDDLPKIWNQMYEDYLGIRPQNDSEGILQDIHWSEGAFGYFFSYAIGSAIASELAFYIDKQVDLYHDMNEEKLINIRNILKNGIHQYGCIYNTNELLNHMINEDFDPKYYIKYLKSKFIRLYGLNTCK